MTPTNELRFVEREVSVPWEGHPEVSEIRKVHILQQKWENTYWTVDESGSKFIEHEWRDVSVEKETDR